MKGDICFFSFRHGTGRGGANVSSYRHIIISSYYHVTISSYHTIKKNGVRLKSFLAPKPFQNYKPPLLPLLQGSLPKNKGSWGNNFWRRICQRGSKIHSSSKTPLFWKNHWFRKKNPKKFFGIEKWKVANRPKRVLPKFHADRSHVRGVSIFFFGVRRADCFFFPARHGTGRGGAEAPEKKNNDAAEGFFFTTFGLFRKAVMLWNESIPLQPRICMGVSKLTSL